ncbi:MAG: UvrD-helicase domain-containing protein [Planctomycetota bacterium]|jgi:ATP-dependent exoDNAse (exonuclease V) beta subunit
MTAAPRIAHRSILASAGSGKTYQLSTRYIELLARDVPAERILATTFTRLAAGEIQDRLLHRLAEAVLEEPARRALDEAIGGPPLTAARAADLLEAVTGRIHRLQVRTLDSFFAGIVHAFALQLGLPPGMGLVDEHTDVLLRREALRRVLDRPDPDRLVELLRVLTEGSEDRAVGALVGSTVDDLYDVYLETRDDAWSWMARRETLSPGGLELAVDSLALAVPTVNAHRSAHARDVEQARAAGHDDADGWRAFFGTGLAKPIATADPVFRSKPIESDVLDAYDPVIRHGRAVLWNAIADRTSTTGRLLGLFHDAYTRVKRERHALTFDDLTRRVIEAEAVGTLDEIRFRLDARLHHLLLDEFQDTSAAQWRALDPFAREIVADGGGERTFFCVGDLKQSIYGWRDASPEILASLPDLLGGPGSIRQDTLAASRRSSPEVIDVVNRVFTGLTGSPALERHGAAAAFWQRIFEPHTTVRRDPGYVELRTVRATAGGEKPDDVRLAAAAALARDLHRADPRRVVGILLRTNRAVGRVLFELGPTRLDVPAEGRGGGSLLDAAAVNAVLDAVRLADHPDHTAAAFHVARGPLGPVVGLAGDGREPGPRRAVSRRLRETLMTDGYAPTIEGWVKAVAGAADPRELRRLGQLVELAALFDAGDGVPRPSTFVELAGTRQLDDAGAAPVRVMTIHQSKGLEFDAVILPDLEWAFGGVGAPKVAIDSPDPVAPAEHIVRWVSEGVRAPLSELDDLFERHRSRMVREDLCVLYVAMTRARRALHMLVDPKRSGQRSARPAHLLAAALDAPDPLPADEVLFSVGDRAQVDAPDPEQPAEAEPESAPVPAAVALAAPAARPRRVAAPSALGGGSVDAAFASLDDEAAEIGTAVHRMLERVTWLEDGVPGVDELERVVRRALPRRDAAWARARAESLAPMLDRPAIRALLSRNGEPEAGLRLWREQPYARIVDDALERGIIDRMVARRVDGRVDRVEVIDFKTDGVDEADAAARAEHHRPQLERYRAAAAAITGCDPARVRLRLAFVAAGVVVDLDDDGPVADAAGVATGHGAL